MTTAVAGLIKIGSTGSNQYKERMRFLEANGYSNVAGLKRNFAIEVNDYNDKEKMLQDIFVKHQVGDSELFALDTELVKQLLLAFEGKVIFPEEINKEKVFDEVTEVRKQGVLFSFYKKGIQEGNTIRFIDDDSIVAKVVGEREVEYDGQKWKLSPLTAKIYEQKNKLNSSGAYQGVRYWNFNNTKLIDIKDKL